MQVPEHLVSLYIATCGQNGSGLGADEKEIILLVYIILEASSGKVIDPYVTVICTIWFSSLWNLFNIPVCNLLTSSNRSITNTNCIDNNQKHLSSELKIVFQAELK